MTATNSEQFEILLGFMEENEGIAKSFVKSLQYKETTNMKWNEAIERLNSAGPPEKTVDGWKKVWKDYKYNRGNKMRTNKRSINGTGGGPCKVKRLSNLEGRVSKLLSFREEVKGIAVARYGCEVETVVSCDNSTTNVAVEVQPVEENINDSRIQHTSNTSKRQSRVRETTKTLLQKQVKLQEKFGSQFKTDGHDLRRILKDQLVFDKRKWEAKKTLLAKQTKQKYMELELKKRELDLRERELDNRQYYNVP